MIATWAKVEHCHIRQRKAAGVGERDGIAAVPPADNNLPPVRGPETTNEAAKRPHRPTPLPVNRTVLGPDPPRLGQRRGSRPRRDLQGDSLPPRVISSRRAYLRTAGRRASQSGLHGDRAHRQVPRWKSGVRCHCDSGEWPGTAAADTHRPRRVTRHRRDGGPLRQPG